MYRGLQYKTRGNVSPSGKARVYFCCCQADFMKTFSRISDEILSTHNRAAVWYRDPSDTENGLYDATGTALNEDFAADLLQMQLFVIPVTADFLFTDNSARILEYAFALEHHIPVLPIMQEGGLESEFNRICGDIQFLYKNDRDVTALPYEEKLKKFLDSVLVGDELAERVRAAFDAYIFLSYRKKDRKYAQEIMHLIHQNDFCRDVAIWYDEFLTPGENFNEAIADAMEKSSLFAMVVTPSLLEDPNYVMTTEYPEARKADKHILPVIAADTDYDKLRTMYEGIGLGVDKNNRMQLSDGLRRQLGEIARSEAENDPSHLFFMALAYLSGIDVEIDHERAVRLMTAAAEENLPEAYEKLVTMYNTGEGVERSYETAIAWQKKYVSYLEKTGESEKIFDELDRLTEMQINSREMDGALADGLKLESMAEASGESHRLITAYGRLSEIYRLTGHFYKAVSCLKKSAARSAGVQGIGSAVIYNNIARIYGHTAHFRESIEYQDRAARAAEELLRETEDIRARRAAAGIFLSCGSGAAMRRPDERKNYLEKAISVLRQLIEEADSDDDRFLLSDCYAEIGTMAGYEGMDDITLTVNGLTEQYVYLRKALSIREELNEKLDTVESMDRLSDICVRLARTPTVTAEERKEYILRSKAVNEKLYARTHLEAYQEKLRLDNALLSGEEGSKDPEGSDLLKSWNLIITGSSASEEELHQMSLDEIEELEEICRKDKTEKNLLMLADRYDQISEFAKDKDEKAALKEKALAVTKALAEDAGTPSSLRTLAKRYHNLYLTNYFLTPDKFKKALEYLDLEMDTLSKVIDMTGDESDTVAAVQTMSMVYKFSEDEEKRDRIFNKIQELTDRLHGQGNIDNCLIALAEIYDSDAEKKAESGEYRTASEIYSKSAEIYRANADRTHSKFSYGRLASSYEHLTECTIKLEDYSTATDYCLKMNEVLSSIYDNTRTLSDEAGMYSRGAAWLARIKFCSGDFDAGFKLTDKGLDYFEGLLNDSLQRRDIPDSAGKMYDFMENLGILPCDADRKKIAAVFKRMVRIASAYLERYACVFTELTAAKSLESAAIYYYNTGDFESSLRYYAGLMKETRDYYEATGARGRYERDLKYTSDRIEMVLRRFPSAREALQAFDAAYGEVPCPETAEIYARALVSQADLLLKSGDRDGTARHMERALSLMEKCEESMSVSRLKVHACNVLGNIASSGKDYETALNYYQNQKEAGEKLVHTEDSAIGCYMYFTSLYYIGTCYENLEKPQEAIASYREALAWKDSFISGCGDNLNTNVTLMIPMYKLLCMEEISAEEKKSISLEMLPILDRFKDEDPGVFKKFIDSFRSFAEHYSGQGS